MIKFSFKKHDATLELDTDNAESPVTHKFVGSKESLDLIKEALYNSSNMFGHLISEDAPVIDINHALLYTGQTDVFDAEVVEGQEIIDAWVYPEIPEGALT
jgi:hypothetical protein